MPICKAASFPRKREPRVFRSNAPLGPRLRGDDEASELHVTQFAKPHLTQFVEPHLTQFVEPHLTQFVEPHLTQFVEPHLTQFVEPHISQYSEPHVTPSCRAQGAIAIVRPVASDSWIASSTC
jgi:hypothetical protein